MSEPDNQLLAEFNARRSEEAFAALVRQHVNLVFATALRQVGDAGAAEEITQNVFVALAQAAGKLGSHPTIAGWLHQTALNKSREWLRSELRRRRREQVAVNLDLARAEGDSVWSSLVPLLDEALLELREPDRLAVILHFMEGQTFQEVGSALGIGEDTARKRVNRCLGQLTHFFRRRGFAAPALVAGAPLFTLSSHAAPAGLAASATTAGLAAAHSAAASTLTLIKGALKIMAWTKAKTAIITGTVVLLATVATTTVVVQHHRTPPVSKTDLSASEVRSAVTALVQERLMWSQLTNLSAHITIESGKKENGQITGTAFLEGDMKLRRIILSQAEKLQGYQRWEMVVLNTVDGWVWKTDGTPENTEVIGQNKQMVEQLEKLSLWNKEYPGAFVVPEQLLTMLYRDSLFSTGPSLDQILSKGLAIYSNQQAQGTLQSYVYQTRGGGQMSGVQFSFVNGHISGYKWPLGRNTQIVQSFEAPIESNHFWYPTEIHADVSDGSTTTSETIKLSNIVVNGPPM